MSQVVNTRSIHTLPGNTHTEKKTISSVIVAEMSESCGGQRSRGSQWRLTC